MTSIDWSDPECLVSKHFTVREALWLPTWKRLAVESDGLNDEVKKTLVDFLVSRMDPLRDFLGVPIIVHCCYRPPAYNAQVGGAPKSAHMALDGAAAMDFDVGEPCDWTRAKLLTELTPRNIRMENNPHSSWVHIDNALARPHRYFKP